VVGAGAASSIRVGRSVQGLRGTSLHAVQEFNGPDEPGYKEGRTYGRFKGDVMKSYIVLLSLLLYCQTSIRAEDEVSSFDERYAMVFIERAVKRTDLEAIVSEIDKSSKVKSIIYVNILDRLNKRVSGVAGYMVAVSPENAVKLYNMTMESVRTHEAEE
jgi:hypothetical protein